MKSMLISLILFLSFNSYANVDCRTECTKVDGDCTQLGIRGRASALHLNEILNAAQPTSPLRWPQSSCKRTLTVAGNIISSQGATCVEWMEPYPDYPPQQDNGTRALIQGDLSATIARSSEEISVIFDQSNSPDFSFIIDGTTYSGGKVALLSHVPAVVGTSPRLLIQAGNTCFSID